MHPRNDFAHKGNTGNALIIAGSYGMCGASVLATKACLRSGVGKVTTHTPKRNYEIMQISVPEAVLQMDSEETSKRMMFPPNALVNPNSSRAMTNRNMIP